MLFRSGRSSENSITLNNQGKTDSFGGDGSHVRGTHSFDYSTYTIDVIAPTGGNISDSLMPTLSSISVVTDTLKHGELASVNYVGDGTGSDLTDVVFYFRNEASGSQFSVSDQDGDGNATAHVTQTNLVSGTYVFNNGRAVDQNNNQLNLRTEDFDASITLVMPDNLNDPQTDYEFPTFDDLSFVPDIA